MYRVVFAHGWGFDKYFWADTIRELKIDHYYLLDFGYTGNKNIPCIDQSLPLIGIGHSLGFAWLLKNLKSPSCLISVSGFECFYKIHDRQSIEKMRKNIKKNKIRQMRAFHKKAGLNVHMYSRVDEQSLLEGLDNLSHWNYKQTLDNMDIPVFAISSEDDRIIPVNKAKEIFRDFNLQIVATGKHVIPINNRTVYLDSLKRMLGEFGI